MQNSFELKRVTNLYVLFIFNNDRGHIITTNWFLIDIIHNCRRNLLFWLLHFFPACIHCSGDLDAFLQKQGRLTC
ncbi:MAG: hypothetical protein AAGM67_16695 [Bacteroidota bacterium]